MIMISRNCVYVVLIWAMFCLVPISVFSQPDKSPIKKINGKEYFIHTVKRGETVSGICKKYKALVSTVMNENPNAGDNIKPGDELKIPVTDRNRPRTSDVTTTATTPTTTTTQPDTTKATQGKKHTVERGETIYGIARKYGMTQEALIALNPGAADGIAPGDVLLLSDSSNTTTMTNVAPKRIMVGYNVKPQETLFSISRKFNISVDSIKLLNNGLPEGLKSGSIINLNVTEAGVAIIKNENGGNIEPLVVPIDRTNQVLNSDFKSGKKEKYTVGLIMPFMFEKNQQYMRDNDNRERSLMYEPTRQSMDFYHGVKLALDSLSKSGLNVTLNIYDTARDTVAIRKICETTEFSELDLIIGPIENVELVGRYAKKYRIPMVCPAAYSNRVLLDNPFIFKMVGSASVMADKASRYIVNNYKDQNIIIIDGKGKNDIGMVKAYTKYLNRYLMKETGTKDSVKVLAMDYFSMKTLEPHIITSKKNIIVIPSNDFVYVSVAMSNLHKYLARYNHKTVEVIVFGTEEWIKMEQIDVNYKLRTQTHIPAPALVDFDTLPTQNFTRSFRHNYKTDPDKYALMGFDVSYFWLAGYLNHGLDFNAMVTQYDVDMLHTGMRFIRLNETSGYLNSNVYILKYENFRLIPQKQ